MKYKKYMKDGLSLAGVGIGLSAASAAASGLGAPTGGINAMSNALPTVGGIYSMNIVLDSLETLKKKSKFK